MADTSSGAGTGDRVVLDFLSPAWLDALEEALSASSHATQTLGSVPVPGRSLAVEPERTVGEVPEPSPDPASQARVARIGIGQLVTGGPHGDTCYIVHLGGNESAVVERDTLDGATVTLVTDYVTAAQIASGSLDVTRALSGGSVLLRGDARALREKRELLAKLGPALVDLAASTAFPQAASPEAGSPQAASPEAGSPQAASPGAPR